MSVAHRHDWLADALQDRDHPRAIADRHRDTVRSPVSHARLAERRPWDGAWAAYAALSAPDPRGLRVLVPCCGFGEDAIRLARLGFAVHATDPAPELLDIASRRAAHLGVQGISFARMAGLPGEQPDGWFDRVYFADMLHHVDIADMLAEARRVLKPGGLAVVNEHYTHSALQAVRDSRLVADHLHHRMVGFIYGAPERYVSEDGHKIDQHELAAIAAQFAPDRRMLFFSLFSGRVLPADWRSVARLDRFLLNLSAPGGRLLAGRVVIAGRLNR